MNANHAAIPASETTGNSRPASKELLAAGRLPLFDPGIAHPARVYRFWLGGRDHYPADREAAREVIRLRPEVLAGARANRAFGQRVVRYAASAVGIRQFLDIGAGLPAPGATHQTAQRVSPACRTVYADNDPLVTAHCRALLASAPGAAPCGCIDADLRKPADLLDGAAGVLDFSRPVAVLVLAVLHFLSDADGPASIVADLAAALAPGSLIAVSHVTGDYAPDAIASSAAAYNARVPLPVHPRSRAQLASILGELPVQHPGIVPASHWQPGLRDAPPQPVDVLAAVARLPLRASTRVPASLAPAATGICPPGPRSAGGTALNPAMGAGRTTAVTEEAYRRARAGQAELARCVSQFPDHDITREVTVDRVRFVARGRSLGVRPSLVMTGDLGELYTELTAGRQAPGS